jgi:hypothetical protein
MRAVHRVVGFAFVVVFLGTGLWMRASFPAAHQGLHGMRMMFRSAHVYILLAALLNLLVAAHWRPQEQPWRRWLQQAGSVALAVIPVMFTIAFFVEPAPERLDRPWCLVGVVLALSGTAFHTLVSFGEQSALRGASVGEPQQ